MEASESGSDNSISPGVRVRLENDDPRIPYHHAVESATSIVTLIFSGNGVGSAFLFT